MDLFDGLSKSTQSIEIEVGDLVFSEPCTIASLLLSKTTLVVSRNSELMPKISHGCDKSPSLTECARERRLSIAALFLSYMQCVIHMVM